MVLTVVLILVLICEYRLPKSEEMDRSRLEKVQKRSNAMIKRKTTETPVPIYFRFRYFRSGSGSGNSGFILSIITRHCLAGS